MLQCGDASVLFDAAEQRRQVAVHSRSMNASRSQWICAIISMIDLNVLIRVIVDDVSLLFDAVDADIRSLLRISWRRLILASLARNARGLLAPTVQRISYPYFGFYVVPLTLQPPRQSEEKSANRSQRVVVNHGPRNCQGER